MTFPNQILVAAALAASFGAMAPSASATDLRVPQDFETIQAAVDQAIENDRVIVSRRKQGPYSENVVVNTDNVILLGKRAEIDGLTDGIALQINANGVTVSGFIIRNASGNGIQITGDNALVERCDVQGCNGSGIAITGSGAIIERNTVRYVGGNGIDFGQSSDEGTSEITRNKVSFCGGSGIVANGGDMLIERNNIDNCGGDGIQMDNGGYSDSSTVASNRIRTSGSNGICVFEVSGGGMLIERNNIDDSSGNGTVIEDGSGATLDRNTYRDNGGNGICITAKNCIVANNRITSSVLNGIKLQNVGDGEHEVVKNSIKACGRDGILAAGGSNDIRDNTCDKNLGDGIDIEAQLQGDSANNTVSGNRVNRNGHEGIDNSGFETTIISNKASKNGPGGSGPDIAGSGNKADPEDVVGIGTVAIFENNKTSDETGDGTENSVPQVRDF